jgi:uncharacterized protein with LGFP repeats
LILVAASLTLPASAEPGATPPDLYRPVLEPSGISARDVRLGDTLLNRPLRTSGVDLVGLTWRGEAGAIRVRTRSAGSWTDWRPVPVLEDRPDDGSTESSGVSGTDLLWVDEADRVEVDVAGPAPAGLSMALIDVSRTATTLDSEPAARASPGSNPLRPRMLWRNAWGADPRLRDGRPAYNRTIQQVHVHHTVNSNRYSAADVPGLIRAIYRYHTVNLGWSDIGYNFLIDRFGRTWTGRAGGIKRAVRGAHTLGFNSTSTGVALIGNFEIARPSRKARTALVHLAAWKLAAYHRDPRGTVTVLSRGSDRYRPGQKVRLPVLDGHRDTNETACPGARLYERLPAIRSRTAERIARFR